MVDNINLPLDKISNLSFANVTLLSSMLYPRDMTQLDVKSLGSRLLQQQRDVPMASWLTSQPS